MAIKFIYETDNINWDAAAEIFLKAYGREKDAKKMMMAFNNSMFKCFLFDDQALIGFGRALADGVFAAYIADIALDPAYQGKGYGKAIVKELMHMTKDHKKVILYANPGKEEFYGKLGFKKMNTAMAIFKNEAEMIEDGVISEG